MSEWIHVAALNHSLFLSACIWPCWTVKWDRLVPSFNSCQHLLIMARTVLIKRGTHLPSSLALHWLTEPHDSTGREDHGEQKRSHLAAAELIRRAERNRRKGWHHVRQWEEFSNPTVATVPSQLMGRKFFKSLNVRSNWSAFEDYSQDTFTENKFFIWYI